MPLDPAVDTNSLASPIMASVEVGGSGQLEQQVKRGYSGCETGSPHSDLDISIRFRNIYINMYVCIYIYIYIYIHRQRGNKMVINSWET